MNWTSSDLKPPKQRRSGIIITLTEDVSEMEILADSANLRVDFEVIQRRNAEDPSTFLGKGKFERLRELLMRCPVDLILVNGILKPKQHFNIENGLKIECLDRVGLVLLIFADKARDKKASLQVEKARLEYEIPLLREWIHSARMGEHPGFLGSGEYQIDVYYDLVKKRIRKISEELKVMTLGEGVRRRHRKIKGFFLVGIAGYTNAGKSSLLNRLTGEKVLVEDRMFSTLSTTTRRMNQVKKGILISDTVGFMRNLPHFMIESFMTTIEDLYMSDMVLLVIDSSNNLDEIRSKLDTSIKILLPETLPENIIVVLNKTDLVPDGMDEKEKMAREMLPGAKVLPVSLIRDQGVDALIQTIIDFFSYSSTIDLSIPNSSESQSFISHLYDVSDITSIKYDSQVTISLECRDRDLDRISKGAASLGGHTLSMLHRNDSQNNPGS